MQKNSRKRTGAKIPLVLLSIFLFLLLFAPAASAATYGDINDDGEINVQDVVLAMKHVLELETLTAAQQGRADVNGDGVINVQDVTLIMQYSLGLIDDFPLPEPDVLEVVSVMATDKKIITVLFNKPVENPEDAVITVKKNPSILPVSFITASWVDPFDKVELKRSVDYDYGAYTVTIKGLGLDEDDYTLTIEPEKVGEIVITSSNLVISDPSDPYTASGNYRVYNQYGEDVTVAPLAANLQWTTSLGGAATVDDNNQGKVTVSKDPLGSSFATDDILTLTVIDPSSGVSAIRVVGVVDTLVIEGFEFGEVTPLPAPRERVEVGWNPAAKILVAKALDEDGIERKTFGELQGQITLVSSDGDVYLYLADKDGGFHNDKQAAIYVDTSAITTARTITISVIINATGEIFNMSLDIHEEADANDVEIGNIEDGKAAGDSSFIIAEGDSDIYLPLTVRDQFGVEREPWQVAADYINGEFSFESSNSSVIDPLDLSIETSHSSSYRGYLKIANIGSEGYTNIKVTVIDTGKYDIKEVVVSAPREPEEIYLPEGMVTLEPPYFSMVQGSTRIFEFSYKDQYGDSYEAALADDANYQVDVSIERYSGDPGALSLAPTGAETLTNAQTDDWYTLTADNTLAGVYKVKGVLQHNPLDPTDIFETMTYIEVVEEVPGTLINCQATDLKNNWGLGQIQQFQFTLEGELALNETVVVMIPDSKGILYSGTNSDYAVSGALGTVEVLLGGLFDVAITFTAGEVVPSGTEITITASKVDTGTNSVADENDIIVGFGRIDSGESCDTTFDVAPAP